MKVSLSGLYNDNPAIVLLPSLLSYQGITDAAGNAFGTSLIDSTMAGIEPSYVGAVGKLLDGGAAGQARTIIAHNLLTGALTVAGGFTTPAGAVQVVAAGTRFVILSVTGGGGGGGGVTATNPPVMSLYEGWQDELGIDFTLWTVVNPATGAAWTRGASAFAARSAMLRASAAPAANEVARLVGNQRWPIGPNQFGTNTVLRVVEFEFELGIANLARLDNTQTFWGFTPNQADTRASVDIVGFALVGGANDLQTLTDLAGAETVTTGFGENLVNLNKLKIRIIAHPGLPTVHFYLNEALIASHIATLSDFPMYPNFYFATTAAGICTPEIGIVRIWTQEVLP